MKKLLSLIVALLLMVTMQAVAGPDEEEAIKEVIANSYIKAIHQKFDEETIMAGFHPKFIMFLKNDEGVRHMTIQEWVEGMRGRANPDAEPRDVTFELAQVSVEKDVANARVEVFREGKHVYSDFFLFYKTADGWMIVGKAFTSHN